MESRVSKLAAAAVLLLCVAVGPVVFAAPAQPRTPADRVAKVIRRIRQLFTPTVLIDEWPQPPVPGKP
jgi:hypothetical protein